MDRVEGLMKSLKLSDLESKGRKIAWTRSGKAGIVEPQALAKLLSDKPAYAEGMINALGRIWCPLRGLDCKDLGDNVFMFTFHQHSGKRKALNEGPWMFNNSLLVVEDFDPAKGIKDYMFVSVPIWVRVFDLPLGMMCRDGGLAIGDIVGEALEVDAGSDGMAVGKFLRVKIRMDITKPIMRGFVLDDEDDNAHENEGINGRGKERKEEENWCRFEYEFLPDFCYIWSARSCG
ncbi:LRR receptor-like serine/threonine-protein kinase FLS2 [Hordeum vulgare]|nr:LRR receptor-like serine/threonine-protein kinase FLS2 [Hordeum vulgare]